MANDFEILKKHLLELPFEKLMVFPHVSVLSYFNGKRNVTATIWSDLISSDEIQFHVQIPSRWFGFLGVGFDNAIRICRNGTWRYLTPEEWIQVEEMP